MEKNLSSKKFKLIAKTLSGLENILADEIRELGGEKVSLLNRSVEFEGDLSLLYKANYCCRLATRILMPIDSFKAEHQNKLYDKLFRINWASYFDVSNTIAVDSTVNYSSFKNSLYIAQLTKDAIVDKFRKFKGRRPSVDIKKPQVRINIHIHDNNVTISLDSSGEPLSRRGYRLDGGKAPLNEVLAAGIIQLSEWDKKSTFIDPMCGSGTFVIEAAMLTRKIPSGYNRKQYSFMNWKNFDSKKWDNIKGEYNKNIEASLPFQIYGSDRSKLRIRDAKENAKKAGVLDSILFEAIKFEIIDAPKQKGTIIMNPPYGERMAKDDMEILYQLIGDTFKNSYEGFNAFVLSGNMEAVKKIGLKASRRIKLFNGPIECRLMKYEIYKGSKKNKNSENE
ncbi:MAG: class I SAM-dependent RNA methyltransferase [candidate division Zixibacteria bacterium]|nr:class I SAM-dependent RNA methyltransferase [candidate division Zixibacteria bacterium]